jgi:hypothetical protein
MCKHEEMCGASHKYDATGKHHLNCITLWELAERDGNQLKAVTTILH